MRHFTLFLLFLMYSCSPKPVLTCYNNNTSKVFQKYINNTLTIKSSEQIIDVTIDEGTIKNNGNGYYMVRTGNKNHSIIYIKLKSKTEEILFSNRDLPVAEITMSGVILKDGDTLPTSFLKAPRRITPLLFTDLICNDFNLQMKTITIIRINKNNITTKEILTEDVPSRLVSVGEDGDTFIFTDGKGIFADWSSYPTITCKTIKINVKD